MFGKQQWIWSSCTAQSWHPWTHLDALRNSFEISLSTSIPPSLWIIPTKYNIIVHLWTYTSYKLLESRRATFASPLALEYLQGDEFYPSVVRSFKFFDLHGYEGEYSILPTLLLTKTSRYWLLARFSFLSPTGSLLLRFLILISVMLNLISMIGSEEPGVIVMLMFTSRFSWHSLLS